ncbi:MAG: Holliday junction resolvase RuvX [Candidatus Marinimicrobia bacterium]|nr:Holliday junction resolvase RuvX [Candidatus Neomarinimicrobiota bacterium]
MARILGIDYGERRIGLALSDPTGIIARPLLTLDQKEDSDWNSALLAICREQEVGSIVVGYPLNMKGEKSPQTDKVDQFILLLRKITPLPVHTYDERLTSVAAKRELVRQGIKTGHDKGAVDRTAAALLLQDYLDAKALRSGP